MLEMNLTFMVTKVMQTVRLIAPVTIRPLNAPFHEVKYRTMGWKKAAALMLAETVSLGVRSPILKCRMKY